MDEEQRRVGSQRKLGPLDARRHGVAGTRASPWLADQVFQSFSIYLGVHM